MRVLERIRAKIVTAVERERMLSPKWGPARKTAVVPSMPELPRVRLSAASQTLYIDKTS
jgi:hypothetical protein